jgi:hypothetical protein
VIALAERKKLLTDVGTWQASITLLHLGIESHLAWRRDLVKRAHYVGCSRNALETF